MTELLCGLVAVVIVLLVALWMRHREAGMLATSYADFLKERLRKADAEREEMLERLHGYVPKPFETVAAVPVRPRIEQPGPDDGEEVDASEDAAMKRRGLRENSDGGYLDEFDHLFADFPAYDEWVGFRDENRLPKGANPKDYARG